MIDPQTIAAVVADVGAEPYRARQIYQAITRNLVTDVESMSVLPRTLRAALSERLSPVSLRQCEAFASADGRTRKALFETGDGYDVEAVLMLHASRTTVCVSTQVGCAVGCAFCASGRDGLRRGLSAEEMVDQVLHFARIARDEDARAVTNVVFMGMGEPFHNYDETLRACSLLNDPQGFGLGARAISISTAGVVPGIDRFTTEPLQLNLAVSLHAATDDLRTELVPLNRVYPLDDLLSACSRYVRHTKRKLMFEYVVLSGVNDTPEQERALKERLRVPLFHLNLIAYNETGGAYRRPGAHEISALCARLQSAGIGCTVRHSPGQGIAAACGQLARRHAVDSPE